MVTSASGVWSNAGHAESVMLPSDWPTPMTSSFIVTALSPLQSPGQGGADCATAAPLPVASAARATATSTALHRSFTATLAPPRIVQSWTETDGSCKVRCPFAPIYVLLVVWPTA